MPNTPRGKHGIYAYIDLNVYNDLWEYIKEVYPDSTYGAFSTEIQNAIVEYLNIKHAQIHTIALNPRTPTVHKICREIVQAIKDQGFINQVSSRALSKIIAEIRGSDRRTIRKWIEQLNINGYIKHMGTYTWEVL